MQATLYYILETVDFLNPDRRTIFMSGTIILRAIAVKPSVF